MIVASKGHNTQSQVTIELGRGPSKVTYQATAISKQNTRMLTCCRKSEDTLVGVRRLLMGKIVWTGVAMGTGSSSVLDLGRKRRREPLVGEKNSGKVKYLKYSITFRSWTV